MFNSTGEGYMNIEISERYMTLEISPKEYGRKLDYDDALLYCSLLVIDGKDDCRMPFSMECIGEEWLDIMKLIFSRQFWYFEDNYVFYNDEIHWVIPVRDL